MSQAPVREFMTTNVTSMAADTPLVDMATILAAQRLQAVVIVDQTHPVGVVDLHDMAQLGARLLQGEQLPSTAGDLGAHTPTVDADDNCDTAAAVMRRHKCQRLIVTDHGGTLCGLIDQQDLLRARLHRLERLHNGAARRAEALQHSLEDSESALRRSAQQDPLLGIGNRFAMDEALRRAAERDDGYAVALIDIDHFKRFNDYYNHAVGDAALRSVCHATRVALNDRAVLYRQSGNTLLALFDGQDASALRACAAEVLDSIAALNMAHTTAPLGRVSVSIGAALSQGATSQPNHVVFRALNARDQAKLDGGNRCTIDDEAAQERAA